MGDIHMQVLWFDAPLFVLCLGVCIVRGRWFRFEGSDVQSQHNKQTFSFFWSHYNCLTVLYFCDPKHGVLLCNKLSDFGYREKPRDCSWV